MCFSSRPSVPDAPAPPPPSVVTPQDPAVLQAQDADRRRRASVMGRASTISTGGQGLTMPVVTSGKSLLGA